MKTEEDRRDRCWRSRVRMGFADHLRLDSCVRRPSRLRPARTGSAPTDRSVSAAGNARSRRRHAGRLHTAEDWRPNTWFCSVCQRVARKCCNCAACVRPDVGYAMTRPSTETFKGNRLKAIQATALHRCDTVGWLSKKFTSVL